MSKSNGKSKRAFGRVDMQVSLLTASIVLVCAFFQFVFCYKIAYDDMISTLQERVGSVHTFVEREFDKDTFCKIDSHDEFETELYKVNKEKLNVIRDATGVRYLYTAKRNDVGELIYVVDGLDYSASDFRYPGDLIEIEIQADLARALNGETVMPDRIIPTEWGKIFIAYLPIHGENDTVIGAVGIEFPADRQYHTYEMLKVISIISATIFSLISVAIAVYAFRRISNPNYRDLANTDRATQLKNRNSFDVEMDNINAKKVFVSGNLGVMSIDLDNLKKVNDLFGHARGDAYIKFVADVVLAQTDKNMVFYRVGGDEIVGIIKDYNEALVEEFAKTLKNTVVDYSVDIGTSISVSVGYAKFDPMLDTDLSATYKRADVFMYESKREGRKQQAEASAAKK